MANCVSMDVTKMVIDNIQRVTETMLNSEKTEINRLQRVIDEEREFNRTLLPNFPRRPPSTPPSPPPAPDPSSSSPQSPPP